MKKHKFFILSLAVAVVLLVLVGGQSVLRAQQDSKLPVVINNYAEGGVVLNVGTETSLGGEDLSFGAIGTRFPNGLAVGTTTASIVAGQFVAGHATATSTLWADLQLRGGTFDMSTSTATSTDGVFIQTSGTATSTLSVGKQAANGSEYQGCIEMVRSDGTFARAIIDGTSWNIQAGRCN